MRRLQIGGDPDAPLRGVTLPASWDDAAGAALAALAPGIGGASIAAAAEGWIRPLAERARRSGLEPIGDALHALLRRRQGAPSAGVWQGEPEEQPGFVLNLAAFHDATAGFDTAGFEAAVALAVTTLTLAAPASTHIRVAMADLAGLLAGLGLGYDSAAARDVAVCLAALLRARADNASARLAGLFGISASDNAEAAAPVLCVVPGLAAAAAQAWAQRSRTGLRHAATTAIGTPGPVEALLGVETGGIAPAFSPLAAEGGLTRTARAFLAARGLTAEAALADLLAGIDHLPAVEHGAVVAMHDAVAPYVQVMPVVAQRAEGVAAVASQGRRELPARRRGYAQRASVGGHTLFLRTGEYEDGSLGEICITPQKETAAFRGLMDSFSQAVSIGLQHGVKLEEYVEAFTLTRFGAAGAVEGDPAVARATSPLDYVFRHLAVTYLHRRDVPPAVEEEEAQKPLLPLLLPQDNAPRVRAGRRAALRVVEG
jgi:hypothetical protein